MHPTCRNGRNPRKRTIQADSGYALSMSTTKTEPITMEQRWVVCIVEGGRVYASAPIESLMDAFEASELCEGSWIEPYEVIAESTA